MTFSEFANLLFPYIGKNQSKDTFVIELVRNIMKEPTLKSDIKLDEDGKYISLPKEKDSLYRIFNGTRQISAKTAREILSKLDKERFELYISDFPDDTITLIASAFQKNGIEVTDKKEQIPTVCAEIFVSILEDCANKQRKLRTVTPQYQPPEAEQAISQVAKTQTATAETIVSTEEEPPLPEDSSDGIDDISLQGLAMATEAEKTAKQNRPLQTVDANYTVNDVLSQIRMSMIEPSMQQYWQIEDVLPMSVNPFHSDSHSNMEKPLSHPRYWRDDLKKHFESYGVDFGDLNPQLKSVWESVRIIDEFLQCYEYYKVADFVAIDPLDFGYRIDEAGFGAAIDDLDYILRTMKFINHMKVAVDYVLVCDETEEIHSNITNYVTTLHKYIDFLRKHSTNSNLFGNSFILVSDEYDDKEELERQSKKFREDLQSQYKNIKRKKEDEQQEDKGDLQVD